jgi:integrase
MKKNNKEHNSIFVKQDGDPAQATSARIWSEKIEKILGCNFYPHAMRHYFTTHMARLSIPSELIQEIVGWNSEGMVKLYNDMGVKDRKWEQLENIKKHYDNKE